MLDKAVAYAKERRQFGRVIGSFQAIKHRCAELAVSLESARVTCRAALGALDAGAGDLALASHLAAATCSDTYLAIARAMIQLHGGIGFTWEHSAHLHFKRAKTSQLLLGSPASHRRLLGQRLGLVAGAGA
jgi:alkylation response protein AidB-like acyl-CoA dehydrogenase